MLIAFCSLSLSNGRYKGSQCIILADPSSNAQWVSQCIAAIAGHRNLETELGQKRLKEEKAKSQKTALSL